MFRVGDYVRIAHSEKIVSEEHPFEESRAREVGKFGYILRIQSLNLGNEMFEIKDASPDIEFRIRSEILNAERFPSFYTINSFDVINYTLLGNEEGDRLFHSTRSRDLSWLPFLSNTASILNEQMEKNLDAIDDSTKTAEVMTTVRIMKETFQFFYYELFNFQLKVNRGLRAEAHLHLLMELENII